MSDLDVCTLGAAHLDAKTNAVVVQALIPTGAEDGDHEPFGEVDVACALGVTALPAPATKKAHAEGIVARGIGNSNGIVVGARDTRSADVVAKLAPGESCLHSTGEKFDSRVFCKDQMVAVVVGDDLAFVLDRKNEKVTLAAFGLIFEMSKKQGFVLESGGAGLTVKDGVVHLRGTVILGGMSATPASRVAFSPAPGTGTSGAWSVAPNVYVGM